MDNLSFNYTIEETPVQDMDSQYEWDKVRHFSAPVANMGQYHAEAAIQYLPIHAYTPFLTSTSTHDYYSERFALEPEKRPVFFAGDHYSDRFALSDCGEDLPLLKAKTARQLGQARRRERERKAQGQELNNEGLKGHQRPVQRARNSLEEIQKASDEEINALGTALPHKHSNDRRSLQVIQDIITTVPRNISSEDCLGSHSCSPNEEDKEPEALRRSHRTRRPSLKARPDLAGKTPRKSHRPISPASIFESTNGDETPVVEAQSTRSKASKKRMVQYGEDKVGEPTSRTRQTRCGRIVRAVNYAE